MRIKEGEMHQYIVIKRTVIREAYEVTAPSEGDAIELVRPERLGRLYPQL